MTPEIILNVDPQECIDCAQHFLAKNWSEAVTCVTTIVSGIIIRAIEKRKIKKQLREEQKENRKL
jgi:hypothetical protein